MPVARSADPKRTTKSKPAKKGPNRLLIRGKEIITTAKREQKRQTEEAEQRKKGFNVFRFMVPHGEKKEIVILDESIEAAGALWEHRLKENGKWNRYVPCIKNFDACPICASGDRPYYGTYLSVLDLTPWERQDGTVIPATKRLMLIKANQLDKFYEIEKACIETHGTLRGCYLVMGRGEGDKAAAIGEPMPQKGGRLFQFYSEDELVQEFGHKAVKNDKDEIIKPRNDAITAFDYDELFPEPTDDQIEGWREEFGDGAPVAGSRKSANKAWDDDDDDDESDTAPDDEDDEDDMPRKKSSVSSRKPVKARAPSKSTRAAVDDDEEDDDDDDEEEEEVQQEVQPRRGKAATPKASTAKSKSKTKPSYDDEEDDEDDDEEEVVTRRPRPGSVVKKRHVVEDDDDDEEDDDDEDEDEDDEDEDEEETPRKKRGVPPTKAASAKKSASTVRDRKSSADPFRRKK